MLVRGSVSERGKIARHRSCNAILMRHEDAVGVWLTVVLQSHDVPGASFTGLSVESLVPASDSQRVDVREVPGEESLEGGTLDDAQCCDVSGATPDSSVVQ